MVKTDSIKFNQDNTKINIKHIITGTIISIILTIIFLLIFSIILVNTNIKENSIRPVVIIITAISILIGTSLTTIKIKKNGILNGAIIGGLYIGIIYIFSSIIFTGFGLNFYSVVIIISTIITGMLGGIIGVNIK